MVDDSIKHRPAGTTAPYELGLLVLHGPHVGTIHRLELAQVIVGRGDDADVCIADGGMSRNHAELILSPDGVVSVFDLGSTNGVFVNGTKVERAILQLGDVLELGPDVRLRLVDAEAATCRNLREGITRPVAED